MGDLKQTELSLARTLIKNMVDEFTPAQYHEDYRERLYEAIKTKIDGKEIAEPPKEYITNVIDIMDALRKSIQITEQKKGSSKEKSNVPPGSMKAGKKVAKAQQPNY